MTIEPRQNPANTAHQISCFLKSLTGRLVPAGWFLLTTLALSMNIAAQSWTSLNNGTPLSASTSLLLTDGTVMVQSDGSGSWFRLTPDLSGSYVNGTWSQLANMPSGHAPQYYASAVLPDGRVVVVGGENNNGGTDTGLGSIYDPRTNSWTSITPPSGVEFGDAQSVVLTNGTLMVGGCCSISQYLLDASNLTWTLTGRGKVDPNSEETWTLLPNGRVLTVDTENGTNSETYIPAKGKWVSAGSTIQSLTNNGGMAIVPEIGPAVLRPDGTVIALGANSNTAIYDSNSGLWSAGPPIPFGLGVADGPAALLPSGNVLVDAGNFFSSGTQFFEFNGSSFTTMPNPANASIKPPFEGRMLVLPTGQILFTDGSIVQIYTPAGTYQSAWQPTITSVSSTLQPGSTNNVISGTQFNGLSQGAMYGDDAQSATNYPLVRITNNATSHVFYARTHAHSTMAVATGSAAVSTQFDVPAAIETGSSTLQVVVNGIPSSPVAVSIGSSAPPPNYVGYVDHLGCDTIGGWAADRNRLNTSINVSFYDGTTLITTVLASVSRPDVGAFLGDNGLHGYNISTPAVLLNGAAHTVHVKFENSSTELTNSPASLTCIGGGTGTIQGSKVDVNGALFNTPGATITLDSGSSFGPSVNPYSSTVTSGSHTVNSSTPAGFSVSYSACVNCTDHTVAGGHPYTAGTAATVNVPANGFVDLSWQYTVTTAITTTATETCGQVNPGNVSVSCDPSFDVQGNNYDETITTNLTQGDSYQLRLFNIDDHEAVTVNNNPVQTANYAQDVTIDLTPFMTVGTNTIRLTETNDAGPWTYGFSRIRTLGTGSTTFFNESCGQVVPGGVTISCDATSARGQRVGTNYNQTLSAPFAAGDTYSVHLFNVDDHESVYVNSTFVTTANYGQDITVDLTPYMVVGTNSIVLTESNDAGPWSYGFTITRVPGH